MAQFKCPENDGLHPVGLFDEKIPIPAQKLSIQCVDNAEFISGVVVYGKKTFPFHSQQLQTGSVEVVVNNTLPQQETAFDAGIGHDSSERSGPFSLPDDADTEDGVHPDLK